MTPPSPLQALITKCRMDAQVLHEYGDERMAVVWEQFADAVVRAIEQEEDDVLNLQAASEVSGYSPDHLGRLIRDGKLPNAGRKNAPAIRRGDLPLKPGMAVQHPELQVVGQDWDEVARAVVHSTTEQNDG